MKSKYPCPECDGDGEVECCECGSDKDCEACDGSGIDTEKINVKAYNAACHDAFKKSKRGSWDVVENRLLIGRTDGKAVVPISAFSFEREKREGEDPLAWLDDDGKKQPSLVDPLAWLDA